MTPSAPVFTLAQILDTLDLEQVNAEFFVGHQIDELGHHISGGHIAAQALMAASRTVVDRLPHSMHMYFLRAGDARRPRIPTVPYTTVGKHTKFQKISLK